MIHLSRIANISENIQSSNGLETYPFWVGRHDANIWLLQHIVREVGRHNEKVSACTFYLVWKQLLTFAIIQRVGGRHHEALQPPFPSGILDTLEPPICTCSFCSTLIRPVVCSWVRCSAWWPSGSQPATEDGGQREALMLILVQRKHSQDLSAPWSSSLQRSVIWPQPPFNTSVSPSHMRHPSR